MTTDPARLSSTCTDESTSAVLSPHDTTSPLLTWRNGKTTCSQADSLDTSSSPPPPVSSTTRTADDDTSEVKCSVSSSKNMKSTHPIICKPSQINYAMVLSFR